MESNIIANLSQNLKIAPEFVVREYWEMIILQEISSSALGSNIIFKGGTALRLAFNSPRFSVDLDFSFKKEEDFGIFKDVINAIANKYPALSIRDLSEKYYTYFSLLLVTESNLPRNFTIKIEASKRPLDGKAGFAPALLTSPTSNAQVVINTYTIEQIEKEKLEAVGTRRKPRDLFDLWYIASLKRQPWVAPENDYTTLELKNGLGRFLPRKFMPILDLLKYEKRTTN